MGATAARDDEPGVNVAGVADDASDAAFRWRDRRGSLRGMRHSACDGPEVLPQLRRAARQATVRGRGGSRPGGCRARCRQPAAQEAAALVEHGARRRRGNAAARDGRRRPDRPHRQRLEQERQRPSADHHRRRQRWDVDGRRRRRRLRARPRPRRASPHKKAKANKSKSAGVDSKSRPQRPRRRPSSRCSGSSQEPSAGDGQAGPVSATAPGYTKGPLHRVRSSGSDWR